MKISVIITLKKDVLDPQGKVIHQTLDGMGFNDINEVRQIANRAIEEARSFSRPQFIEFQTHRWREHCGPNYDDELGYREDGELEYWYERCPIKRTKQLLRESGAIDASLFESLEENIAKEIEEAFSYALKSLKPVSRGLEESLYARR